MNPLQIQIAFSAANLAVVVLGFALSHGVMKGKFTRAIEDQDRRLGVLETNDKKQDEKISEMRGALGIGDTASAGAR